MNLKLDSRFEEARLYGQALIDSWTVATESRGSIRFRGFIDLFDGETPFVLFGLNRGFELHDEVILDPARINLNPFICMELGLHVRGEYIGNPVKNVSGKITDYNGQFFYIDGIGLVRHEIKLDYEFFKNNNIPGISVF